ncbi:hypothetical protein OTK49_28280 [Vibrio coralliirubri]|uniref:hypothetical protein n=1 Tax=Vibrio coralliirubri TaxID=1516159 RepID=UPI002284F511|nr:hypothetical protein [Vibrio coralliirubri]MCY9866441.1 hypothetical protein [Vibrio coralliirubri]
MPKCCDKILTSYIVCTAHEFCREQYGEDFARNMLKDAGISMSNEDDAEIITSLGEQYIETVKRLTGDPQ